MNNAERSERHEAWNWQCWRTFKGKPSEWVGFFESADDALTWTKTQGGTFVVNNVSPTGRTSSGRKHSGWAGSALEYGLGPVEHDAKPAKKQRPFSPAVKVFVPARELSAEEKALKTEAESVYSKHKADEAKELENEV